MNSVNLLCVIAFQFETNEAWETEVRWYKNDNIANIRCKSEGCDVVEKVRRRHYRCKNCRTGVYCRDTEAAGSKCSVCDNVGVPSGRRNRECCNCACFPASARVTLEDGRSVTMSKLSVGDRVQTVSTQGLITYSDVRTFMKKQSTVIALYKTITTSLKDISLSRNHLIFARKNSSVKFHPIYADKVSVSDEVLVEENDQLVPMKVVNVSNNMMQGAFFPLTLEGNIVVDDIPASCYPSSDHNLAHFVMTPLRWFPRGMDWLFGERKGFPFYVAITEEYGRWFLPYEQMYETSSF